MRKSLFLYLFVFAVVINLFTYMWFSGQQKHDNERIVKIQQQLKASRDSLQSGGKDADYFTLATNDEALDYFADKGYTNTDSLAQKITDGVLELNENPAGNPLTDNEPIDEKKFLINKVQLLNHRWIIADYSNGTIWGDALIQYFIEDDGTITYKTLQSTIYPGTIR